MEIMSKKDEIMNSTMDISNNIQKIEDMVDDFKQNKVDDSIYEKLYICNNNNLNIYSDLEIFNTYNHDKENSLIQLIDNTNLKIGNLCLRNLINTPLYTKHQLNKRQTIIKKYKKYYYKDISKDLFNVKKVEKDILWLLSKMDENEESQELLNMVYFNDPKAIQFLNKYDTFLNIFYFYSIVLIPLSNIISPICAYILPILALKCTNLPIDMDMIKKMFNTTINFDKILNPGSQTTTMMKYIGFFMCGLTYLQTIYSSVKVAMNTVNVTNIIHKRVNNICLFLKTAYKVNELTYDLFEEMKLISPISEIYDDLFITEPSLISNKGKILTIFEKIRENRYIFLPIILYLGKVDAYNSIVKLKNKYNMCYAKYKTSKKPILKLKEHYHPIIKKPIKNSLMIHNKPHNLLITGPNASGKSTFLKSAALNILCAQTLTISFAESMILTPFSYFNTYLNIPDCEGKESLFEAEMNRMSDEIKKIEELENKHVFLIMDEIFSSTNPKEAISGAYSICNTFADYKNLICLVTTHYNYITNLEKDTDNWENYKFTGKLLENSVKYDYKIKKGISSQCFALKLLEYKGFNKKIIDIANNIYDEL